MLGKSISSNAIMLGAFALITAGSLALTESVTREPIEKAIREASAKALLEIIPLDRHSNDMLVDTYPIPRGYWSRLGLEQGGNINLARESGQITAAIVPAVAPDGYSGPIRLLVGVNRDGTVAGVRVIGHSETPGLGDKVELKKSDWILSFNGTSLQEPPPERWKVERDGGDFDQFTGATITPRAVVGQVKRVLEFVAAHHDTIFSAPESERAVPVSGNKTEADSQQATKEESGSN